jgi:hypothetical protein
MSTMHTTLFEDFPTIPKVNHESHDLGELSCGHETKQTSILIYRFEFIPKTIQQFYELKINKINILKS